MIAVIGILSVVTGLTSRVIANNVMRLSIAQNLRERE
jgi:hypothetical protein